MPSQIPGPASALRHGYLPQRLAAAMTRIAGLCLAVLLFPCHAATIAVDGVPFGAGVVAVAADGQCSLIEAIQNAEDTGTGHVHADCTAGDPSGADTVVLAESANYLLDSSSVPVPFDTIVSVSQGLSGLPGIFGALTIDGQGSVIHRDAAAAAFRILTVANTGSLTLQALTLSGGHTSSASGVAANGGGLLVRGNLLLDRVRVTGNTSNGGGGGVAGQSATGLLVERSLVDGNAATGAGADGGGLYCSGGVLTLRHSTVSGNSAVDAGGGVAAASVCALSLLHDSVVANSGAQGGGLYFSGSATVSLGNSLLADNVSTGAGAPNCYNEFNTPTLNGVNLTNDSSAPSAATECGLTVAAELTVGDGLGPLRDNGGPTPTHALTNQLSTAVDGADLSVCDVAGTGIADQRGIPRPQNGDAVDDAQCDVGAFEAMNAGVISVDTLPEQPMMGVVPIDDGDGLCSLTEAIENSNDTVDGWVHRDCSPGSTTLTDQIDLPPGATFVFDDDSVPVVFTGATGAGGNALPPITGSLVIEGNFSRWLRPETTAGMPTKAFRFVYAELGSALTLRAMEWSGGRIEDCCTLVSGGALRVNRAELVIEDMSFTNNWSEGDGGAIKVFTCIEGITIRRSAFLNNSAQSVGAAVDLDGCSSTSIEVSDSSFVGNVARMVSPGSSLIRTDGLPLFHYLSIVDNEVETALEGVVFSAASRLRGVWVANSGIPCSLALSSGSVYVPADSGQSMGCGEIVQPDLVVGDGMAPLALNGGFTPTFAPLPYSSAINGQILANCFGPVYDQRGQRKSFEPPDFRYCEIGAHESSEFYDIGSAPPPYPTAVTWDAVSVDSGPPVHEVTDLMFSVRLGACVDGLRVLSPSEVDPGGVPPVPDPPQYLQVGTCADPEDDDDGILLPDMHLGGVHDLTVDTPDGQTAVLNGWFDVNADGDWDDVGEHLVDGLVTTGGIQVFSGALVIPSGSTVGPSWARFRITAEGINVPGGFQGGGEVEDWPYTLAPSYTVGGSVADLEGSGLVLQNNGGDDLALGANGVFTFATPLADLSVYEVTVLTQPDSPSQTCTVTGGSGSLMGANVTTVIVNCLTDRFTVGGSLSGLAAGSSVVLQNNGGDDLAISADGSFTFAASLVDLSDYDVTVLTQPDGPSQTCTVVDGSGSLAGANVTNVSVNCVIDSFTVGGSLSGLAAGSSVVLQNNGGDDLALGANGVFAFATPLIDGAEYSVTVATQTAGPTQQCTVTSGAGMVDGGPVTDVLVQCVTLPEQLFTNGFEEP